MSLLRWPTAPLRPHRTAADVAALPWAHALPTSDLRALVALLRVAPRDHLGTVRVPRWATAWVAQLHEQAADVRAGNEDDEPATVPTDSANPLAELWAAPDLATALPDAWPHLTRNQRAALADVAAGLGIDVPPEPPPRITRCVACDGDPLRPYGTIPRPPTCAAEVGGDDAAYRPEPTPHPGAITQTARAPQPEPATVAAPELLGGDDPNDHLITPRGERDADGWRRVQLY